MGVTVTVLAMLLVLGVPAQARKAGSAHLRVEIRERSASATIPARVYLFDSQGGFHAPEGAIVYQRHEEHHFISEGSFDLCLPPGDYSLAVERGPEYLPWAQKFRLGEGESKKIDVELERWISMNKRGWYSGDLHNHRKPEEMSKLLLAEDLNLAPTLTDWIWEGRQISKPPAGGKAIYRVDATHAFSELDMEVERLKQGPGAVDLLALKHPIPFNGNWLYPPNDVFCRQAHRQGGYVDAEKIMWRDVPALAALGQIDFAGVVHNHFNRHGVETETDEWGMAPKRRPEFTTRKGLALWTLDIYYRLLNCGFRLPVSAGSASGVKASPLGYNRVYVHLDHPFSYRNWFRALKAGRSFATNGPMLFLSVNGKLPGSIIKLSDGGERRLNIQAEVLSGGDIESLEIIFKGRVVERAEAIGSTRTLNINFDFVPGGAGWVTARAFERPGATIRFAQTSPVYIQSDHESGVETGDAEFFASWMRREEEFYRRETRFRSASERDAMLDLFQQAEAVYNHLAGQVPTGSAASGAPLRGR